MLIKNKSAGFSLIEVMISMLILAFGVLSMGGLQIASLKSGQISSNLSTATILAKDYTEMMRSNTSVSSSTYTSSPMNPYLFDSSNSSTFTATPTVNCKSTVCTASEVSVLHVADWADRVSLQLPAGRAVVCRDPTPRNSDGTFRWSCGANNGTSVTIKLGWIDKRSKEERGGSTVTMSTTALNPQMVIGGLTGFIE